MELRLLRHCRVDSTNERALTAIAEDTACHGDVHFAEEQSAGRGRLGRGWVSAPGEGLYLSLVLLPEAAPHPAALTMGAGLAVLESVHALGEPRARLKWPNDVLVAGAKLAGILVEARGHAPLHAVVGIGLNVRQREFPRELEAERAVTSLARLGVERTLDEAAHALLTRLAPRLEQACTRPQETARDYAGMLDLVGSEVRVVLGRAERRGRLEALTLEGLVLATPDDESVRCLLEHVQVLEPWDETPRAG